ncbi:MAG: DNA mismatch repair protein MutL, partial [Anaerolineales bacterium]
IKISGFTSLPPHFKGNGDGIYIYINRRYVKDRIIYKAIMEAYRHLLPAGKFPVTILFATLPPSAVDVNVHPTKAEVRFAEAGRVFGSVQHAVRRALLASSSLATMPNFPIWQPPFDEIQNSPREDERGGVLPSEPLQPQPSVFPSLEQKVPLLRWIGQIANTYLIAEGPDGLYLIDQHAAHERVLFERFLQQPQTAISSQKLLQPSLLTLSTSQAQLFEEQIELLNRLGFEIVPFGLNTYQVRAVPAIIAGVDGAFAVRAVIDDFEENEEPLSRETEKRLIARICKRVAVKAGQSLSPEEQKALLRELESCQSPRTCPHGRPTMIHLPVDLLERQFGRRGAV